MAHCPKRTAPLILRLLAVLLLLSCPIASSAAGTWSVLSLPQQPGEVLSPSAVAVDGKGNLYVADQSHGGRIQKRDAQGHWSGLAGDGDAPGQVRLPAALAVDPGTRAAGGGSLYVADGSRIQQRDAQGRWSVLDTVPCSALAVDGAGNLYAAEGNQIEERDARGNWSTLASEGDDVGQVDTPTALAVDASGNLYVADQPASGDTGRIQERDVRGHWSVIATTAANALAVDGAGDLYVANLFCPEGCLTQIQKRDVQGNWSSLDFLSFQHALAVDTAGNLYVADGGSFGPGGSPGRIQERDPQGNWSVLATQGSAPGQISYPTALAADAAGDLYLADYTDHWRLQERDDQGRWSIITTDGSAVGPIRIPSALAADAAGNLYVAEGYGDGRDRLLERDPQGVWSVIATAGAAAGQVSFAYGFASLATDPAGNLYVAQGYPNEQIQRRDASGNWTVIATRGSDIGQVFGPSRLAVDGAGSLYVANDGRILKWEHVPQAGTLPSAGAGHWSILDTGHSGPLAADATGNLYVADAPDGSRIQKRDARGRWSVIATQGTDLGQVHLSGTLAPTSGLAVDAAGHLYVADTGNNRVLLYTPGP